MKKQTTLALQYGAATGAAMGLWLFAEHALGFHHQYQHFLGVSSLLSAFLPVFGISALFTATFSRGKLSWKKGFVVGFIASLAIGIVVGFFQSIYVATLNSEFLGQLQQELLASLKADTRFTSAEIAEFMPVIDWLHTPLGFGFQTGVVSVITGMFLSILTILIVRTFQYRIRRK